MKKKTEELESLALSDMLLTGLSKVAGKDETKKQKQLRARVREKLNHRWTYLCGTPQNETHKCIKCGATG